MFIHASHAWERGREDKSYSKGVCSLRGLRERDREKREEEEEDEEEEEGRGDKILSLIHI